MRVGTSTASLRGPQLRDFGSSRDRCRCSRSAPVGVQLVADEVRRDVVLVLFILALQVVSLAVLFVEHRPEVVIEVSPIPPIFDQHGAA